MLLLLLVLVACLLRCFRLIIEATHVFACAVAIRPLPQKNGMNEIEFRNRCARYVTDSARFSTGAEQGQLMFPASIGPQTINLQYATIVDIMAILEERMNAELQAFLRLWLSALEASSGKSVVDLHLDKMTTMPMLLRVYNALDDMGDGDGILSSNDGLVWQFLQHEKIVADGTYVLSLTVEQFRLALVKSVIVSTGIRPSDIDHLTTGRDVAHFVQNRINEEVKAKLHRLAAEISEAGGDCPPLASVAPGSHSNDLSNKKGQFPGTLSRSVVLTDQVFGAARQVFDCLDVDENGNLGRDDFGDEQSNPALAKLGAQIMALDENGDGVVRSFNCGCHTHSSSLASDALTVRASVFDFR